MDFLYLKLTVVAQTTIVRARLFYKWFTVCWLNKYKCKSKKYKKNKIIISGEAVIYEDRKDFDIIHNYINRLKSNKQLGENFSKIKFNQGSLKTIREQEIVEFEIEAALRISANTKGDILWKVVIT